MNKVGQANSKITLLITARLVEQNLISTFMESHIT